MVTMIWRSYIQLFIIFALLLAAESSALAGSTGSISISATVLSSSNCQFRPPRSAALNFGNLDPTNPVPVPTSTTLDFRCAGSSPLATFFISADNGFHFSGGNRRMQNASDPAAYIPYELALSPQTATVPKNADQTLTINGLIDGAGYRYASVGSYIDQVIVSINP